MAIDVPEEEENAAELKLGKTFEAARGLTIPEVALFLGEYVKAKRENTDPSYQPSSSMKKSLDYANRFSAFKTKEAAASVRDLLTSYGLHEYEVMAVANLVPEAVEEARVLVPSLEDTSRFSEEQLHTMLHDLGTVKQFE